HRATAKHEVLGAPRGGEPRPSPPEPGQARRRSRPPHRDLRLVHRRLRHRRSPRREDPARGVVGGYDLSMEQNIFLGTESGLWMLRGDVLEPVEEFAAREVTALARDGARTWVVVEGRAVW